MKLGEKMLSKLSKMLSRKRMSLVLIGLILFVGRAGYSETKTNIYLKDFAWIEGTSVQLGEIAEIEGNEELVERLKKIKITSAPTLGKSRVINQDYIWVRLYQSKIKAQEVIFQGAKEVKITVLSNTIEKEQVLRAIEDSLSTFLKEEEVEEMEVEIGRVAFSFPLLVPVGGLRLQGKISSSSFDSSRLTILMEIYINENLYRTLSIPLKIKIFKEVVVATRNLYTDHTFTREDIRKEKILINVNKQNEEWLCDLQEVLGKRLLRNISAGTPLKKELLGFPLLVNQGSLVTLFIEGENIRIHAQGKALEKGGKGETIKVLNIDSEKRLEGIIIDVNSVRIYI